MRGLLILCGLLSGMVEGLAEELPRAVDERLKIELFAEQPDLVTPTGIDVDHQGRVWAIESNTHFRPDNYQGHVSDRVLVMQDTNTDHRADKITVFTDGLTHTMSVAVRPIWLPPVAERRAGGVSPPVTPNAQETSPPKTPPLQVFIATRKEILLFTDDDGDLKADRQQRLVQLDTPGNYPHNGLAGFAFDAMGWMFFGFGENLGADYKLIGSDEKTLKGGGEGGNVYRCRPDGTELSQWATGFWNPHASCVDAFGRLFTVDNDPDSRPPCRLLHVIEGGDYGYHFRNGRKGLHPFTSWNGEIPGTLPMVAGTGEAPSGIVAYESDGLPPDYLGNLLSTSWGDHRIERFQLKPKEASFTATAEPIIQGGEDFRPVGLAVAPDGSLYCTDWVKKDYKLHGHGRIWRVSAKEEPKRKVIDATMITNTDDVNRLASLMQSPRLDVRRTAAQALAKSPKDRKELLKILATAEHSSRRRIEALWAAAHVPLAIHDFEFAQAKKQYRKIQSDEDVVDEALMRLVGTPQFPLVPYLLSEKDFLKPDPVPLFDKKVLFFDKQEVKDRDSQHLDRLFLNLLLLIWHDKKNEVSDYLIEMSIEECPFLFHGAVHSLSKGNLSSKELLERIRDSNWDHQRETLLDKEQIAQLEDRMDLALLLTARRKFPKHVEIAKIGLANNSEAIRRAAVQWVAEENLKDLRPQVEAVLNSNGLTPDLFLATVAALEMLDGKNPAELDKTPPAKYLFAILEDAKRPAPLRAMALRMIPPETPELDAKVLAPLLKSEEEELRLETVRTLQLSPGSEAEGLLRTIAADEQAETTLRADAVAGLGRAKPEEQTRRLLLELLKGESKPLQREAARSLRTLAETHVDIKEQVEQILPPPKARPDSSAELLKLVNTGGDLDAGRRTFFHPMGAGCFKCHTVNSRGGNVGPDLSVIARTMDRKKLLESLLEPSREMAPQWVTWTVATTAGQIHNGVIIAEEDEKIRLGTSEGKVIEIKTSDIEERKPSQKSTMPEKLADPLTVEELRDLLAYMESLR